jgi:hypothetical protein
VAGTWSEQKGRVTITPFEALSEAARREVADEARRLEAWLAAEDPR